MALWASKWPVENSNGNVQAVMSRIPSTVAVWLQGLIPSDWHWEEGQSCAGQGDRPPSWHHTAGAPKASLVGQGQAGSGTGGSWMGFHLSLTGEDRGCLWKAVLNETQQDLLSLVQDCCFISKGAEGSQLESKGDDKDGGQIRRNVNKPSGQVDFMRTVSFIHHCSCVRFHLRMTKA